VEKKKRQPCPEETNGVDRSHNDGDRKKVAGRAKEKRMSEGPGSVKTRKKLRSRVGGERQKKDGRGVLVTGTKGRDKTRGAGPEHAVERKGGGKRGRDERTGRDAI